MKYVHVWEGDGCKVSIDHSSKTEKKCICRYMYIPHDAKATLYTKIIDKWEYNAIIIEYE